MHTCPLIFVGIKDGSIFNIFKQILRPTGIISILALRHNNSKYPPRDCRYYSKKNTVCNYLLQYLHFDEKNNWFTLQSTV